MQHCPTPSPTQPPNKIYDGEGVNILQTLQYVYASLTIWQCLKFKLETAFKIQIWFRDQNSKLVYGWIKCQPF